MKVCETAPLTDCKQIYDVLLKLYGLVLRFSWCNCLGFCQVSSGCYVRKKRRPDFLGLRSQNAFSAGSLEALELKGPCESSGSGVHGVFLTPGVFYHFSIWSIKAAMKNVGINDDPAKKKLNLTVH